MSGYLQAMQRVGLFETQVVTYRPDRRDRHLWMAVSRVPELVRAIRRVQLRGDTPIVYAHAGAGLSMLRETSLLRLARRFGAKTMIQLHSLHVEQVLASPVQRPLLLRALRDVDVVCVLAPYWQELVQRHHPGKVAVVPNPLPPLIEAEARLPPMPRAARSGLRALTMTRLVDGKGVDLAIRAVAACPADVELVVAGDGELRASLEQLAGSLGVSHRVRFVGWVDDARKREVLRDADVFVLPSTYDSFGMGFVESACFGLPSIGLHWGAIPDTVLDGETGWLVPCGDHAVRDLTDALLAARDVDERQRRGQQARRQALARFGVDAVGERIEASLPV
ncbi:MAG: glycosyltransferase [Deltaproteobacteria bacterium]|nr:MAG: glycosyltransferase [Deltaproteobacteria bacterium]